MTDEEMIARMKKTMRVHHVKAQLTVGRPDEGQRGCTVSYDITCARPDGWTLEEARLVELIAEQQVVNGAYTYAILAEGMSPWEAKAQRERVNANFDKAIQHVTAQMGQDEPPSVQTLRNPRDAAALDY